MDDEILDSIDSALSSYIADGSFEDASTAYKVLEDFDSTCRSKEVVDHLLLNEKDILDTLVSFLRAATDDTSVETKLIVKFALECVCKLYRNCSDCYQKELLSFTEDCNVSSVVDNFLESNDFNRIIIELHCRVSAYLFHRLRTKRMDLFSDLFCFAPPPLPQLSGLIFYTPLRRTCYFLHSNVLYNNI